jgi:ABC-type nitrate/sulfonate/bicarbonate transport system permease component
MNVKLWAKPFETLDKKDSWSIRFIWFVLIAAFWIVATSGDKKLFPSPTQVWNGFVSLYNEGLVVHIGSSLLLCFQATVISIAFSLFVAYTYPIPLLRPLSKTMSRLRYLPLTGITFYLTILVTSARTMQVWVLVIFMSLYFITSLLAVIKDISQEEIDHARSLKCSRWEILWEVIVKGRFDYVIDVLRQNLAITWMMLVTVESILVAAGGLGVLIKNSDKFMNHGRILALQIVILLVGVGIDLVLNTTRKSLFRYSKFN